MHIYENKIFNQVKRNIKEWQHFKPDTELSCINNKYYEDFLD